MLDIDHDPPKKRRTGRIHTYLDHVPSLYVFVKKDKRGACQQKAATVLPNCTAATECIRSSLSFFEFDIVRYGGTS